MRVGVSIGAISVALVLGASTPAWACGGTFCDQGPVGTPPMPVDQTGENVIFVMKPGIVQAHIQIQYSGDPESFAWIVPVQKVPTVTVGSQIFFTNMLNGTVPTFQTTTTFTNCATGSQSTSSSSGPGCGASSDDSGGGFNASAGGSGGSGPKSNAPTVVSQNAVGNFDVTILQPVDTQGLIDWLVQNGFEPDTADAQPVLQDYLSRGYAFVAIKLQPDAGIDEIHPLVIEYAGDEPCVPLKLTRVAAVEDMTVRTFFLGDNRVVPTGGYKHVMLDTARLDWTGLGTNYNLAVARAVDAPVANGRAFVTEYAGASSVVSKTGIYSGSWSAEAFEELTPTEVVPELTTQQLLSCASSADCLASHPLVFPLLETYLPVPAGITPEAFYSCVSCYPEADLTLWDGMAFAADFDELIAKPGALAQSALTSSLYLTRMVTRISPAEMTEDPTFVEWTGSLPDVSNLLSATQTNRCDGKLSTTAPDGRVMVGVPTTVDPAVLPWEDRVEEFQANGDHVVLVDNDAKIDKALAALNGPEPLDPDTEQALDTSNGCACNLRTRNRSQAFGFALLGALGLLRRLFRQKRTHA
jgi:hypothetical protein